MHTITLTSQNMDEAVQHALAVIRDGGVVVTPSETQYGLSADPRNERAVKKIYAIKGRDFDKPLGLVAGNSEIIKTYFRVNTSEQQLIDHFWPGPLGLCMGIANSPQAQRAAQLTLVGTYDVQHPEDNKMIVRISSNPFLTLLSTQLDAPIISTSANISGQPACYNVACIKKQFVESEHQPDLIIDAGELPHTLPSTMLDATKTPIKTIRRGADYEEVEKIVHNLT